MASILESKIQEKIIKLLKDYEKQGYNLWHDKRQAGGFSYKEGMSDIYFVWDGVHVEVEVKAPGGELRVSQEKWIAKCQMKGTPILVAESVEQLKNYLIENNFIK